MYVLGALDVLDCRLEPDENRATLGRDWADRGLRVLLFARQTNLSLALEPNPPADLPGGLIPLGLIGLGDELRTEARETLDALTQAGVQIKIISGDDPRTVAALARQIGYTPTGPAMSGSELTALPQAAFAAAVAETMIFGRIAPDQKPALILELRRQGHHLAMIGDGVNDVLALKQANVGIALGSGSPATRAVADLVLLDDSFAGIPAAIREGQRIQNGMHDIVKLFLTRVLSFALVLVGTGIVGEFPLGPKHNSLLTLMTVGLPAIALAAWARPGPSANGSHFKTALHFVLPAALTLTVAELGVHLFAYLTVDSALLPALGEAAADRQAVATAQTALTTFGIFCGLLLLIFAEPPSEAWVGGDTLSGDRRPMFLAIGLGLAYVGILVIPVFRQFFELTPLAGQDYLLLALVAGLWAIVLRWIWRGRLLERFLDLDWR